MPNHIYTPLRYPGGKAKLGPFLSDLLRANGLADCCLGEPYAGGAGASLFLLFRGYAKSIVLNDIDPGVFAFWRAVLKYGDRFAARIHRVPLSVKEWDHQKAVLADSGSSVFDRGFAFFYLNRTNRSGILNGGIIGGRDQSGPYKIDARFNRSDLANRVHALGSMKRSITISSLDAMSFLTEFRLHRTTTPRFVYLDPPYFEKGSVLYTTFYTAESHAAIARRLRRYPLPWVLTYDDCREIRELYAEFKPRSSEISYSAREVRRGKELIILSRDLRLPRRAPRATHSRWIPGFQLR
jgi:DNA adenine methylase